jgi:hypothetical protein
MVSVGNYKRAIAYLAIKANFLIGKSIGKKMGKYAVKTRGSCHERLFELPCARVRGGLESVFDRRQDDAVLKVRPGVTDSARGRAIRAVGSRRGFGAGRRLRGFASKLAPTQSG